jgi:predicted RNase H-like nuclease (RuvC/YqgF family)
MAKAAVKKPAPRPKVKKPVKAAAKPKAPKGVCATKDDLLQLAPKKALLQFVTRGELAEWTPKSAAGAGGEELAQLDRRIDMIEKRIDATEKKIDALADQLENNTANVDRMHSETEQLRMEAGGYLSREDFDREIQGLRDDIADLTDRLNGMKEDWSEGGSPTGM